MNQFEYNVNQFWDKPSLRFKGGGGGGNTAPPRAQLSTIGKEAQSINYAAISRGMAGGGMMPAGTQDISENYRMGGLTDAIKQGREELGSDISRTVRRGDARTGSAMMNQFDRAGVTATDDMRRQFGKENYADEERSISMATDAIASEKRMGSEITSKFNAGQAQDYSNQLQYGTFGSNMMSGLAEGGMSVAYSNQYAKMMS
jgi:hypothetical protein